MLRYGLIGLGGIGQIHLRWAERHPKVEVCAIADPDERRCSDLTEANGVRRYSDHAQMLAKEHLDVVSITVPHGKLTEIGSDCLEAGCHILLEKPLARHIEEARELLALAKQKDRQIGVCYQYRNFATPKLIKNIIDSGRIGTPRHMIWTWQELRPNSYYSSKPWRSTWDGAGGGLIMNQLIHDLDLLRWFAGEVESVQGSLANQMHDTPFEDALSATILFRDGARATIAATLNQNRARTYRAIMGTEGLIVLPDAKPLASDPKDTVMVGSYAVSTTEAIATYRNDHQQSDIAWTQLQSRPRTLRGTIPDWIKRPIRAAADTIRPARHGWEAGARPVGGHGKSIWDFVDAIIAGVDIPDDMSGESACKTLELANALILSGIEKREVELPLDPVQYSATFQKLVNGEITIAARGDNVSV